MGWKVKESEELERGREEEEEEIPEEEETVDQLPVELVPDVLFCLYMTITLRM